VAASDRLSWRAETLADWTRFDRYLVTNTSFEQLIAFELAKILPSKRSSRLALSRLEKQPI